MVSSLTQVWPAVDAETGEVHDPDEQYPLPPASRFIEPGTIEVRDFIPAPDIEAIAKMLTERHEHLGWLKGVRVSYLWRCKGGASGGKATFGQCQKASGLIRHYSGVSFVVWLAWDHCDTAAVTRRQVEALVYHQLLHADRTEKGKPAVAPHDFEGFTRELEVYGPWQADLQRMVKVSQQLPMFDEDEVE